MLTPIDDVQTATTSGITPQADKQIGAVTSTNGAVCYTVPAGRVFSGFVSNAYNSSSYFSYIVVGSNSIRHYGGFSNERENYKTGQAMPELTLLAGTSVKNQGGSYETTVFGVERDA